MNDLSYIALSEAVHLDRKQLDDLGRRLGKPAAEDLICRSMEELAVRLSYTERLYRQNDIENMHKSLDSLAGIATRIGMTALTRVGGDVRQCIETGDAVAMAATLMRLLRIGERSLSEVWGLQDLYH